MDRSGARRFWRVPRRRRPAIGPDSGRSGSSPPRGSTRHAHDRQWHRDALLRQEEPHGADRPLPVVRPGREPGILRHAPLVRDRLHPDHPPGTEAGDRFLSDLHRGISWPVPTPTSRPASSRSRRPRTSFAGTPRLRPRLQVHATLLGFHEAEQAERFRQVVRDRFPADAELMAGLAAQLQQAGSYQEAGELYDAGPPPPARAARGPRRHRPAQDGRGPARRSASPPGFPRGTGRRPALSHRPARRTLHLLSKGRATRGGARARRPCPPRGPGGRSAAQVPRVRRAVGEGPRPVRDHPAAPRTFRAGAVPRRRARLLQPASVGHHGHPSPSRCSPAGWPSTTNTSGSIGPSRSSTPAARRSRCGWTTSPRRPWRIPAGSSWPRGVIASSSAGRWTRRTTSTSRPDTSIAGCKKPAWVLDPRRRGRAHQAVVTYSKDPVAARSSSCSLGRPVRGAPPRGLPLRGTAAQHESAQSQRAGGQDLARAVRRGPISRRSSSGSRSIASGALTFAERRLRRRPEDNELLEAYLSSFDQPGHMERAESFLKSGLDRTPGRGAVAPALPDARREQPAMTRPWSPSTTVTSRPIRGTPP